MDMPPIPRDVSTVLAGYAPDTREGVMRLRALIYDVAAGLPRVGPLQETLKWGQPAYLTSQTKAGTTLRLGPHKDACFALFAHCQTSVISDYAAAFPGADRVEGHRAVLFDTAEDVVEERLALLIRAALTYHLKD